MPARWDRADGWRRAALGLRITALAATWADAVPSTVKIRVDTGGGLCRFTVDVASTPGRGGLLPARRHPAVRPAPAPRPGRLAPGNPTIRRGASARRDRADPRLEHQRAQQVRGGGTPARR